MHNAFPSDQTAGSAWGDVRVLGAARIASALLEHWKPLGLVRIVLVNGDQVEGENAAATYRVLAANGAIVSWGHAPGQETLGEPSPQKKISQLLSFAKQTGHLPADRTIDLQVPANPSVAAKPKD